MKREILLSAECVALAAKYGQTGLEEHAQKQNLTRPHLYGGRALSVVTSFFFAPAAGECAAFFAFAGTGDPQTDGLEGVHIAFEAHEESDAQAALLRELQTYDQEFIDNFFRFGEDEQTEGAARTSFLAIAPALA